MAKVAIIGGGIAGSSVAVYLDKLGADVRVFEKKDVLVSGPPMCHLHAGGNLYPEITLKERFQLLKESIELFRFYPNSIDMRPTIVTIRDDVDLSFDEILNSLEKIKAYYKRLSINPKNKVLGEPEDYYKIFEKSEINELRKIHKNSPENLKEWMAPFARWVDFSKIKWPVVLVQEYGLNIFRISAIANMILKDKVYFKTEVIDIKEDNGFKVKYKKGSETYEEHFDFLINAAGFESGRIDDMLGIKRERFVEFKAAYVTKWDNPEKYWSEIIFLGIRGSDKGMGQFTPYADNIFQLHAMTKKATLYNDGLVKSKNSSQPNLPQHFINKIFSGWGLEEVKERTIEAIKHISRFIPEFKSAKVLPTPLFGAQQIPGDNPELRAAEVSFEGERYARCEIVKASSVIAMAKEIVKKMSEIGLIEYKEIEIDNKFDDKAVTKHAEIIAKKLGYPKEMGRVNFEI
ncbi:FAD-dependent oxidoreductase [Caminibacter sp.]